MEYYKLLQLKREPFSNSPDPEYFFQSQQHQACLQKLELALRLKRGLNIVIGDVGTGKTTLCREVIRKFAKEPEIETHLILDPSISATEEFLKTIHAMVCGGSPEPGLSPTAIKEAIKQTLFHKGVDQGLTVILIIDEGQKISSTCIEILRELLNYETNTYKLLQIVIFAQKEFQSVLQVHPNFADRVNLTHYLAPMNFSDTRRMIRHRLKLSSSTPKPLDLFTLPALWAIYRSSRGYPRRIIHLCHQSVLAMIIQNRTRAGWALIRSCKNRMLAPTGHRGRLMAGVAAAVLLAIVGASWLPQKILSPLWPASSTLFKISDYSLPAPAVSARTATDQANTPTLQPAADAAHPIDPDQSPKLQPDLKPESISKSVSNPTTDNGQGTSSISKTQAVASDPMVLPSSPNPAGPKALAADIDQPLPPPAILGELPVKYGDTLYQMVAIVYGAYRTEYLDAVIQANPQIDNPNAIESGAKVLFPVIRFATNPYLAGSHWIVLAENETLLDAVGTMAELKKSKIPTRIIANWSSSGGLRFQLAISGYFTSESKARTYLETLPQQLADQVRIVADWPATTQLYADPYSGGTR